MNKQLLLALLILLTAVLTVGAVSASDVNVTDSTTSLVDDTSDASVPLENTADSSEISVSSDSSVDNDSSKVSLSSEEVLESDNSNTLSTNSTNDNLSSSDDGVTVSSNGTDSNVSSKIAVSKTITAKDVKKYYKGSTKYTATFLDAYGKALANTKVTITVNGVSYTKTTNAKGAVSLAVNLKPGTYKIIAVNPDTGYRLTTTYRILSTITASDISKVYTDTKKFSAKFYKSTGKVLANKYIKFKINGKTYKVKTNSKGIATLSLINLKKGTYKIISYNTDGLTKTNKVKVVTYTTTSLTTYSYTFLKSDSKTIKVKLLNKFGYAPGKGKIIKFKVNGKTYSAKTSSSGIAKIKLPSLKAGIYKVTYSFAGNNFYKKCSASSKVAIIATKTPTFTVKSTKVFGYGANTKFQVVLSAGGVPLEKRTVTFKVNGKSYTRTTGSSGVASIAIKLPVGKYTMSYTNKAESKVKAKTASTTITVKERTPTSLTWKSGTSFYQGAQTYKVLLKDSSSKALAGKTVKLTVNSKTYSATTSSSGYAKFTVNVPTGNYTVSFKYEASGDNDYAPTSSSKKIEVLKKDTTGYGYWLHGGDMKSVNLNTLASKGTSDLFLNFYAFTLYSQSQVESWIASANTLGMRVHIWMQAFYDGSWVNPVSNGKVNQAYFEKKITEAQKYASVKGVSGIHLDYLRYPGTAYKTSGGTAAISQFVQEITEAIHEIDSGLIVSAALMPETTSNKYYYGQDYAVISKYVDVVVPMIYKGNYRKTSSWIKTTAKWFVDNSEGAQVWVGLQGYKSDSNVVKLSTSEITSDAQYALNGAASGVIIFRWGQSNLVNFNSLTDLSASPSTTGSISVSTIMSAAYALNNTIKSTGSIPASVSVGGVTYSTAQFLYLLTKAIGYINDGKTSTQILPISVDTAQNPSSTAKSGKLNLTEYLDVASRVSSFIESNNLAPNYASSSLGNIKYESLVDIFARIGAYYKEHSSLPNYVTFNADASSAVTTKTISIKNIITGATNLKTYYAKNKALPSTVTAGGITFTLPEFLYVMSQAIYQIGNSNSNAITYISGVSKPSSPTGAEISDNLYKANYLTVAKNVANYIKTNKCAPNYASSTLGNIEYSELVDAFSRVLAYYGTNSALPNYVTISTASSSSSSSSSSGSSSFTITGAGLNQKNTITSLSGYLVGTTNCAITSAIKTKVTAITKGLTTDEAKARAIFNYVRDNIAYSFYYNTKYGAAGTLSAGKGNCVDHSHLLVAMFRAAGLAARYVHGSCTFSSGSTYGHVWTQVLIGNTWVVADATSSRNSLGSIANWNTKTFTLHNTYKSLSF